MAGEVARLGDSVKGRTGTARARRFRLTEERVIKVVFLGLPLLVLALVFIFPLLTSFWWSLTDYKIGQEQAKKFIGLNNYIRILSSKQTLHSLGITFKFTIGAFIAQFILGFGLALLIDYLGLMKGVVRTLIILPLMMTPIVLGVVWRTMFNYDFGIINYLVGLVGIPRLDLLHTPSMALPVVIGVDTWLVTPFVMMVMSAGLASLPREPYESAEIDGASALQKFWYLTLPLLRPVILVVIVFRTYALLRAFDLPFSLTRGGPARATEVLSYHIYSRMYVGHQGGYPSAVAYILMLITIAIVLFFLRRLDLAGEGPGRVGERESIFARHLWMPLGRLLRRLRAAVGKLLEPSEEAQQRAAERRLAAWRRGGDRGLFGSFRARRRVGRGIAGFIILLYLLMQVFPVYWIYSSSLKEPHRVFASPPDWIFKPTLHNYRVVLGLAYGTETELAMFGAKPPLSKLPQYALNSFTTAVSTTIISLSLGTLAAYVLARFRMRGKRTILTAMLVTRMVPPVVIILPIFLTWRALGLVDTFPGMVLAYLSFTLPFAVWMMRGYILDLPVELEEAAMVDGTSRLGALFRVTLPLAAPGLAATAIFTFIHSWNEFLFAIILGSNHVKPVTVEILAYVSDMAILFGRLFAASGLILLPVLIFTLFVQKYIATGLTGGALKG